MQNFGWKIKVKNLFNWLIQECYTNRPVNEVIMLQYTRLCGASSCLAPRAQETRKYAMRLSAARRTIAAFPYFPSCFPAALAFLALVFFSILNCPLTRMDCTDPLWVWLGSVRVRLAMGLTTGSRHTPHRPVQSTRSPASARHIT